MKRRTKIGLILLGIVLTIALTANYIVKGIFSEVISELNDRESFPLSIEYDRTRFDLYSANFHVFGLKIATKDSLASKKFQLDIGSVNISGLHVFEVLDGKYTVRGIRVENPNFTFYDRGVEDEQNDSTSERRKGEFPHLEWDEIKIVRGSIQSYKINEKDTNRVFRLHGINLGIGPNHARSLDDLIKKGQFKTGQFSFDLGNQNKLHVQESLIDLESKRIVLRDLFFGNELKHGRFFKSLTHKQLWKRVDLDSLELNDITVDNIEEHKHISIGEVNFHTPIATLKGNKLLPNAPEKEKKDVNWSNLIPPSVDIEEINVFNGSIEFRNYINKTGDKYVEHKVGNISVRMNRTDWQDSSLNDFRKDHPFGKGKIELNDIKLGLKKNTEINIQSLQVILDDDKIEIDDFYLKNNNNPEYYIKHQSFKEDWNEAKIESIEVLGLNLQKYFTTDTLIISDVIAKNVLFDSRTAGDLKRRPTRIGPLMHDWFRSFPGQHDIRNIQVSEMDLKFMMYYKIPNENELSSGLLHITHIGATVDRITNMDKSFITKVRGVGSYKRRKNLSLAIDIPVHDRNYKFHLKGKVRNVELSQLNHFLKPMQLKFLKGHLHLLEFDYNSQDKIANAKGTTKFHYDNLQVEILKKQTRENLEKSEKKQGNWLLSTAANMAAKKENLPGHKWYVVGKIDHKRHMYQGFFGHMVGCMMQGAQYCIFKSKDKEQKKKEKEERKRKKKNKRRRSL